MAWESTIQHGAGKGQAVDDEPSGAYVPRVALGAYGGSDAPRTRRECHRSFINRLETHGHTPEQAARVAHRCGRVADERS